MNTTKTYSAAGSLTATIPAAFLAVSANSTGWTPSTAFLGRIPSNAAKAGHRDRVFGMTAADVQVRHPRGIPL